LNRLFIYLRAPAIVSADRALLPAVEWVLLDDQGEFVSQAVGDGTTLSELVHADVLADPANVVVVVPTETCLALTCTVPGRSVGQMRRALPFVVEEFLASDLDDVHVAHGPLSRDAPVACVAIERVTLDGWIAGLKMVGVTPGHLFSEAELLPSGPGQITCLFRDDEAIIRGHREMLSVASDETVMGISAVLGALDDRDVAITAINGRINDLDRSQVEQTLREDQHLKWLDAETDVPATIHLARAWLLDTPAGGEGSLNLLQADYAPPRRQSRGMQGWRTVAAIAAIFLVVLFATQGARGIWADYRADALDAEARAFYQQVFPNDRRIVDVRSQWAAHIGEGTAEDAPFIPLLGELAKALNEARGTSLKSLSFT
jgi:general secretion pathway protein L